MANVTYDLFTDIGVLEGNDIIPCAETSAGNATKRTSPAQVLTYVQNNIVTTQALNAGSITSGFGSINVGANSITTTGLGSFGTATVASTLTIGSSVPFSDSAGTLTLQNIDVIDATTEATIEASIDTLSNLTSAPNLVTVGALNSGSITSGFGSINVGSDPITSTGTIQAGVLSANELNNATTVSLTVGSPFSTAVAEISSGSFKVSGGSVLKMNNETVLTETATVVTLSGIDAIDATTKSTIENSLTTFPNLTSLPNLVTVGALNSGSITSGFGSINTGADTITTTGLITAGDLNATGDISINGTRIFAESAGVVILEGIDLIDGTTENTFEAALDSLVNLTSVGALSAGSIVSGFGSINNGSNSITTTGTCDLGGTVNLSKSFTNYVSVTGSTVNGDSVNLTATGSNADVSLTMVSKGAQGVRFAGRDNWCLGNDGARGSLIIAEAFNNDRQVALEYTPGTTGAAAGVFKIGQLINQGGGNTHGITEFYTSQTKRMSILANGNVEIPGNANGGKVLFTVSNSNNNPAATSEIRVSVGGGGADAYTCYDDLAGVSYASGIETTSSNYKITYDATLANMGSTSRLEINTAGAMIVGAPTGSFQSAGTINAQGVYDDGILLTCYVFDKIIDGNVSLTKWDSKVPDRIVPVKKKDEDGQYVRDEDGNYVYDEPLVTVRMHEPLRKFLSKVEGGVENPLDIDQYANHWKTKRHLTSMPNETKYNPEKGLSTGEWIQRLVETVETQAFHIENLNQRLKTLESA